MTFWIRDRGPSVEIRHSAERNAIYSPLVIPQHFGEARQVTSAFQCLQEFDQDAEGCSLVLWSAF